MDLRNVFKDADEQRSRDRRPDDGGSQSDPTPFAGYGLLVGGLAMIGSVAYRFMTRKGEIPVGTPTAQPPAALVLGGGGGVGREEKRSIPVVTTSVVVPPTASRPAHTSTSRPSATATSTTRSPTTQSPGIASTGIVTSPEAQVKSETSQDGRVIDMENELVQLRAQNSDFRQRIADTNDSMVSWQKALQERDALIERHNMTELLQLNSDGERKAPIRKHTHHPGCKHYKRMMDELQKAQKDKDVHDSMTRGAVDDAPTIDGRQKTLDGRSAASSVTSQRGEHKDERKEGRRGEGRGVSSKEGLGGGREGEGETHEDTKDNDDDDDDEEDDDGEETADG